MPVPSLPNLAPPFAPNADLNCVFKIKNSVSTGTTNALGNPIIDYDETTVSGWAVREADPKLVATIGASAEEMPIKVWVRSPDTLPSNFATFKNVECELDNLVGYFRPVKMIHPLVPANFAFVIGAFKGVNG